MLGASTDTASATFFFITDQRSVDRTPAAPAPRASLSTTGETHRIVYGHAADASTKPGRAGRR